MAVSDWSSTAASNTTINGVSIAEGCAPSNINDAIRYVMASVRVMYDNLPSTTNLMPKSGGAFAGSITRSSAGGYLYHNASSLTGGAVYVQTTATALPSSPAEGTIVFQY